MKHYYFYLAIGFIALFSVACGSSKKVTTSTPKATTTAAAKPAVVATEPTVVAPPKPQGVEYKMKVVLSQSTSSTIPDDITKLVMPITDGCDQTTYVNFNSKAKTSPELNRLATPEASANLSAEIAGGLNKNMSVDEFKQRYQRSVEERKLDYSFTKPVPEGVSLKAAFDDAVKTAVGNGGNLVLIYAPGSKEAEYMDVPVYTSIAEVRAAIAKELCVNKTSKDVVVYYEIPETFMAKITPAEISKPELVATTAKPATPAPTAPKTGYDDKGNKLPPNTKWDNVKKIIVDARTGKPYVAPKPKSTGGLEEESTKINTIEVKDIKK
jgi:hypothetical protein